MEPTDARGMPLSYVTFQTKDPNTADRWAGSGVKLAIAFTALGLLSRGDLWQAILMMLEAHAPPAIVASARAHIADPATTAACIVVGSLANGALYRWGCDRFEREYYPEFYGGARRDDVAAWKCQPGRSLSAARHREERFWGTANAVWGTFLSLTFFFVAHVRLGWTRMYFDSSAHGGLPYFLLSFVLLFAYIEIWAYWSHRFWHVSCLYARFHKWHHRYQPPTPFSAVAFHPFEFFVYVVGGQTVFYFVPIHPAVAALVGAYTAYYLVADHSGVKCEPVWPWQPTSQFHDDHHRYFHCNFGQHVLWLDRVFGTLRSVRREYGEAKFVDRWDGGGGVKKAK